MKMSLGAFIAHLRKEKGLTQKQLSEILNVSDKTVSHWEREESSPDISLLPLIADTFSITVDELLRGERKNDTEDAEAVSDCNSHTKKSNSVDDFHIFRQKNTVTALISVISGFCGTVVLCLLNYTFYIPDPFNSAVKIINVVPLALNIIIQAVVSVYALITYSNYTNNHKQENIKQKAFRLTTITFYSAFFSLFTTIGSTDLISSWSDYGFFIVCSLPAALIIICTELCLIKKGYIPKWQKKTLHRLLSVICSVSFAFILLFGSFIANTGYAYKNVIYDMAEYTEFQTQDEFESYIEREVPVPSELYNGDSFYDIEYGVFEEKYSVLYRDNTGSMQWLFFDYNNGEVSKIIPSDGNGFPIKCYTHSALLAVKDKAEVKITITRIGLFALYPLSLVVAISMYFAIKKKKGL